MTGNKISDKGAAHLLQYLKDQASAAAHLKRKHSLDIDFTRTSVYARHLTQSSRDATRDADSARWESFTKVELAAVHVSGASRASAGSVQSDRLFLDLLHECEYPNHVRSADQPCQEAKDHPASCTRAQVAGYAREDPRAQRRAGGDDCNGPGGPGVGRRGEAGSNTGLASARTE